MDAVSTHFLNALSPYQIWDTQRAHDFLVALQGSDKRRSTERALHRFGILPTAITPDTLTNENGQTPTRLVLDWDLARARAQRQRVLFAQLHRLPDGRDSLVLNDGRGAWQWIVLAGSATSDTISQALQTLSLADPRALAVFPHHRLAALASQPSSSPAFRLLSYPPRGPRLVTDRQGQPHSRSPSRQRLEDESIHILREAVAESQRPAMLYSIGKDSAVMLHLARKAFFPAPPPFPLVHVDTRWKFRDMYLFRDAVVQQAGMPLITHINPEAITRDINPFDHGSARHTDITKTEGLKQVLEQHRFDLVFGGARRDEEKSRAKERVFSFRNAQHRWDPRNQRPELWHLFNTRLGPNESMRVFPLSNWTELDIWQYIRQEDIPVVPLYFAKPRPVVNRDGMLILVDDDRFRLLPGESIEERTVRFRTLGCYPLSGAIESRAESVDDIIRELTASRQSERQGRVIDRDGAASMERKKQEGYF
jgi:sulfate adenylyltransferase subunit 2